jgi:ribosome biogenesis GTPase
MTEVQGRIVSLLSGFYYVQAGGQVITCRARGKLRHEEIKPLVGDMVVIDMTEGEPVLERVLPRKNLMTRPAVANVDQMVIVFSASFPEPNTELLDRLMVSAGLLCLSPVICVNKSDTATPQEVLDRLERYRPTGVPTAVVSARTGEGLAELKRLLREHISVFAGQSGVGKSSLINALCPGREAATGALSGNQAGEHTTRHTELLRLSEGDSFIVDTPGFNRLDLPDEVSSLHLPELFPEFDPYLGQCQYGASCRHVADAGCAVRAAVAAGAISPSRYDNYVRFRTEVEAKEHDYR